jgi:hypothetical protein
MTRARRARTSGLNELELTVANYHLSERIMESWDHGMSYRGKSMTR